MDIRRAYDFFRQHAGWIVGEKAKGALSLARAERAAQDAGVTFEWTDDDDGADAYGDHEYWCKDAHRGNCEGHEVLCCVARHDGRVLASLGGVIEPSGEYARVIEAQLASEALDAIEATCPTCKGSGRVAK